MQRLLGWYDQPDEVNADPETSFMTFSVHSWVIELDGKDDPDRHLLRQPQEPASCCPKVHQLDTDYLGNLRRAGFAPGDIDMVMCTHLHFDHVGWNTKLENGKWVPTFPNARYVFGRRDFEYFKTDPDGEALHNRGVRRFDRAGDGGRARADVVDEDRSPTARSATACGSSRPTATRPAAARSTPRPTARRESSGAT
jgi:glyoxylase-like metal-dependent hydrolase (beta-lactamase superfamily II)